MAGGGQAAAEFKGTPVWSAACPERTQKVACRRVPQEFGDAPT